jgi:tetratricopeptide (TPR) repeat protein
MGDYQRALDAYRRGLSIREELKDTRGIAVSLNAVASVEAKTDPNAALRTYQRVLTLRRQVADERGEMATEIAMGDVCRDMGKLTDALGAYERALAIAEHIDAPLMESSALKGVADVEAARGNYRRAYEFELRHHHVRDEMFNQENAARLARLQVTHETEQQQRLIQLQQAELAQVRTVRTALAVTAGLVLLSLGLVLARYRLKQQSEARLRAQAEELQEAIGRVQTLKGLLPICASCKKIRDDNGYWTQVEQYVTAHSAAEFTHSICPSCFEGLYPEGPTAHHEV